MRETGWERATARVLDRYGQPAGAGFLISGNMVLTCAHVVSGVLGLEAELPLPDGIEVMIDFPLAADSSERQARVFSSVPVASDGTGDLAVLLLEGSPPADARPLYLLPSSNLAGHRWSAFGFPLYRQPAQVKDAGIWTFGTIEGPEATGWWQLTVDPAAAFSLAEGFSGAAVWDKDCKGVAGMIVAFEDHAGRRTGYALTIQELELKWPRLHDHILAENPYRELRAFTDRDAGVFFGRANDTERLMELLVGESRPIVPILGASGVGKSSLVGAGLLARLTETGGYLTAHVPYRMFGTAEEMLTCALTSAGRMAPSASSRQAKMPGDILDLATDGGLLAAADRYLTDEPDETRLLIIVDQFEELALAAPDVAGRLDAMLGVLTDRWPGGLRRVQAVVVARIDFLKQLEAFPHIIAGWNATNVVIPPLTRDQLREVITRPLDDLKGTQFSSGLVDQILLDTPSGPAALPLLEYALSQLWDRQEGGIIPGGAYFEIGGVGGALARAANQALWERVDVIEQPTVERVLIQLVLPGEQLDAGERAPDSRRVASRSDFSDDEWALLNRLARTRLLVISRQGAGPDTAELAHEALLRAWPRLATWVQDNRDFRTWQEALRRAMREWQRNDRHSGLLLDETHVKQAQEWEQQRPAELSSAEHDFVAASTVAITRQKRRRGYRLGAAVVVFVAALSLGGIAIQQHLTGNVQRENGLSQQIASEAVSLGGSLPNVAKQLRIAAYQIAPTAAAYSSLSSGEQLPGTIAAPGISDAVYSQDGRLLALVTARQVRLWSTASHSAVGAVRVTGGATTAAFDGRKNVLAIGNGSGTIQLWDIADPRRPVLRATIGGLVGPVEQITFASGGSLLAAAGWDHDVDLWNFTNPAMPIRTATLKAGASVAASVAISSDGRLLAAADWDHTVDLWNITNPSRPGQVARLDTLGVARSVAFEPGGQVLAVGGDGTTARTVSLWSVAHPRHPRQLAALATGTTSISALAFSPTAPLLAAASPLQGRILLWDTANPAHPTALPALSSGSRCVAFSPDGQIVATLDLAPGPTAGISGLNVVNLWDVTNPQEPAAVATVQAPPEFAGSVAADPDGRFLAEAAIGTGSDEAVELWNISNTYHPTAMASLPDTGATVAVARNGNQALVAVGGNGLVTLWEVTNLAHAVRLDQVPVGGTSAADPVIQMAFSPSGGTLAVLGSGNGVIRLWSLRNLRQIAPIDSLAGAPDGSISFGAGGRMIADAIDEQALGPDLHTDFWDLSNPRHPTLIPHLTQRTGETVTAVLDPAAAILATSDVDGAIRLWNISDPTRPAPIAALSGIVGPHASLAFSSDGHVLVGADENGDVHLWNVTEPGNPVTIGTITPPAGSTFIAISGPSRSGGSRFMETVNRFDAVDLWDTGAHAMIDRLCQSVGDYLTAAQWHQYIPESTYVPPCGGDGPLKQAREIY